MLSHVKHLPVKELRRGFEERSVRIGVVILGFALHSLFAFQEHATLIVKENFQFSKCIMQSPNCVHLSLLANLRKIEINCIFVENMVSVYVQLNIVVVLDHPEYQTL